MVEKKVPNVRIEYYTKQAKEIKNPSLKLRLAHTRKSAEMNLSKNAHGVEKKLSKQEQEFYFQKSEAQIAKDERYMKRIKKKKKMIIEGHM